MKKIIVFLKENEKIYRMVIGASSPKLFIDKLKTIIAKRISEKNALYPFTTNVDKKAVQIYFLTSACVDTVVEYFKGHLSASIDLVGK